ncbi:MAG: helix-turn-helix domain-containing protein [Candidatus Dormibacteria bacterium]
MDDTHDLTPGSLVRRWRLGKQLRDIREAAGKTMEEAAAYLGIKRPTISRIENGRHTILARNVKFLCQFYGVGAPTVDMLMRQSEETEERGWWATYSDTMPDWFETYVGFETDADEIWIYGAELIPGLLQVPEYVRGIWTAQGSAEEEKLAKSVEFRLARQQRLTTKPPRLRVVLNEAALIRQAGSAADMVAQLNQLVKVAKQKWATIQVLPFSAGPHASMNGPFSMLTLPGEPDPNFVYLEHIHGALYLERPVDLERYTRVFESLTKTSLSASASRDYLATLVTHYSGEQKRHKP